MNDAGRIGFVLRNDYSPTETYDFLDVVYYNGASYVAKKLTVGHTPTENNEYWHIFAESNLLKGVKGNNESSYKTGYVNLTAENIGALPEEEKDPDVSGSLANQIKEAAKGEGLTFSITEKNILRVSWEE